jgi:hypothetical protein
MVQSLRIVLNGTPAQFARLRALQFAFAEACNAIAAVVQSTRCWNRVALHHLVYRNMRARFPALGSQMICNAVYSVSRNARLVLQHPKSPWNVSRLPPGAPLPLLRFSQTAPVCFDRHTLSLKHRMLSMFTLDGRIRFDLSLSAGDEARFHREKLIEIMLASASGGFDLVFHFAGPDPAGALQQMSAQGLLPEYVLIVPLDAPLSSPPVPAIALPRDPADRLAAP